MSVVPPAPCTYCGEDDRMTPETMHPTGAAPFVRWFCECGASTPDSVLRKHAARASATA